MATTAPLLRSITVPSPPVAPEVLPSSRALGEELVVRVASDPQVDV
jgi:hypothetical protein